MLSLLLRVPRRIWVDLWHHTSILLTLAQKKKKTLFERPNGTPSAIYQDTFHNCKTLHLSSWWRHESNCWGTRCARARCEMLLWWTRKIAFVSLKKAYDIPDAPPLCHSLVTVTPSYPIITSRQLFKFWLVSSRLLQSHSSRLFTFIFFYFKLIALPAPHFLLSRASSIVNSTNRSEGAPVICVSPPLTFDERRGGPPSWGRLHPFPSEYGRVFSPSHAISLSNRLKSGFTNLFFFKDWFVS